MSATARPCACMDCAPRVKPAGCAFPVVVLAVLVLAWLIACGAGGGAAW